MPTLSVCMIVKNEHDVLARCLECARQFADEIVVVDTGSTDDTPEIARRYTDRVFFYEWNDDFSAARNFSFSKATCDYIMWLDADDVVDAENIRKLNALKQEMHEDVLMLRYHVAFDEQGKPTFTYYRERIVRREKGLRWKEPVHEYIAMHGTVRKCDIAIVHGEKKRTHSRRNLEIYQSRIAKGERLSTRGLYYYARELQTHGLLDEAVQQYTAFLERGDGWKEDAISACCGLSDCYVRLGKDNEALQALFGSFLYDVPRAPVCCRIGDIFMRLERYTHAEYWYHTALRVPQQEDGFVQTDYHAFIPHIQLCCLYEKMQDRQQALVHHEESKRCKPGDPRVLYNDAYFYPEKQQKTQAPA